MRLIFECSQCGKLVSRTPSKAKNSRSGKIFCSRSCVATHTAKNNPSKFPTEKCTVCGKPARKKHNCLCEEHRKKGRVNDWSKITRADGSYKERTWGHSRREWNRVNPSPECYVCGYKTHVQVSHRKSVSSFPIDTPLSIINHISNLVGLCPNHHWELDNGIISLI